MKVDILAIGAHPDDVELGCGGTIAKLIAQGKKIAIIDLTKGELGTRGTEVTRAQESQEASKILKIEARENLEIKDGFILNVEENQMKIVQMVRKYQPDIVFANAVDDRHPDHGKAAKLTADACFLAGLVKIQTTWDGMEQKPWRPKHIFHYIQWRDLKPDFAVDISDYMDIKIEACMAYKSQFFDPKSNEPMTPIATKDFLESLTYRAQNLGRLSGCKFAEGFNSHKLIALDNLESIIL